MRYAICYISTAKYNFSREDIAHLFENTILFNNKHKINGILIYSEGNFFQFIEGEEEEIIAL